MNCEPELKAKHVFMRAQQALRVNLDRVLSVSGDDDGEPRQLSISQLSRTTGIARSTVTKLLRLPKSKQVDGTRSDAAKGLSKANPDLDTLCRLASELAVPPAFLLMTPNDWNRLIQAFANAQELANLTSGTKLRNLETTEIAKTAEGVYSTWAGKRSVLPGAAELENSEAFRKERDQMRRAALQRTRSMAVLVNWDRIPEGSESAFLLAMCVHIAAGLAAEAIEEAPNVN